MSKIITFTKMHGNGNDFVILDRIMQYFYITTKLIQNISNRHIGIGCDQVLIIDPPSAITDDFYYHIFNADGTEVQQCVNGACCVAHYVFEQGFTQKKKLQVANKSGQVKIKLESHKYITVSIGHPNFAPEAIPILLTPIQNDNYMLADGLQVRAVSMGNPHCLIQVPTLKKADVVGIGKKLQTFDVFPQKTNVTFIETLARNHLRCRVYERGVGETAACGSAACAAVVSGIKAKELSDEVRVDMPGGHVTVRWGGNNTPVYLTGPAHNIYQGRFLIAQ